MKQPYKSFVPPKRSPNPVRSVALHGNGRPGKHRRPEVNRTAILMAAVAEFAEHGIAGARTDRIARTARVNKALLYYYFKDKEALYSAVLDHVFSGVRDKAVQVLDSALPPREKLMEYVAGYFDHIAANPQFPRVVQAEWMRAGSRGSHEMRRIGREYFAPIFQRVVKLLREGAESGDFRPVNPMDFQPALVGLVIFYFSAAPAMKTLLKIDPLSKQRIAERRKFVLEFVSKAMFR